MRIEAHLRPLRREENSTTSISDGPSRPCFLSILTLSTLALDTLLDLLDNMPFQWTGLTILMVTASYCAQCTNAIPDKSHGASSQQPTSNISLAAPTEGEVPDARPNALFYATIVLGEVVLPYLSLLMLGVEALATLAWKDHTAYSAGTYMLLEGFPDAAIAIVPQIKSVGVMNEVAVRCILFGMHHVAKYQEFKNATIDCFWLDRRVASVLFGKPRDRLPSGSYHTPLTAAKGVNRSLRLSAQSACTAPLGDNITCALATTPDDVHPHYFYHLQSREISVLALFMTIMVALEYFSFFGSTIRLPAHRTIRTAWDTSLRLTPDQTRKQPPFCETGWLIETVRRIPSFMLEQNKFAEISIAIIVDGVFVGDGLLEKGRPN